MIRLLVVVGFGINLDIKEYQRELSQLDVVVTRENDDFLRVVCEHNPQAIVSLGDIGQSSFLWSLPLWRRGRWLNLPDGNIRASAIRMAALTLVAATCGGAVFTDEPLVSCVAMDGEPRDVARSIIQTADSLDYDNIEFLVPEHLFNEVIMVLGAHPVIGAMCKVRTSLEDSPSETLRGALSAVRGKYILPITSFIASPPGEVFRSALDVLSNEPDSAVVIGESVSRETILHRFEENKKELLCHVMCRPEHLFRTFQFEHDFPLQSLSGLLLSLVANSTTHYIHVEQRPGEYPLWWWQEHDPHHHLFLQALINFTKQLQTL